MPGVVGIFGIIFVAILLFTIIKLVSGYIANEKSPIIATKAIIIDKKRDEITSTDADGMMSVSESFYIFVKLDTGSEMKFSVSGRVYKNIFLNEWGTLTFQGTRFLKFESTSGLVER